MADTQVIHEHGSSDSGMSFIVGAILIVVALLLFVFYGLPYLRNTGTPQVNVPSQIDVNVRQQE